MKKGIISVYLLLLRRLLWDYHVAFVLSEFLLRSGMMSVNKPQFMSLTSTQDLFGNECCSEYRCYIVPSSNLKVIL